MSELALQLYKRTRDTSVFEQQRLSASQIVGFAPQLVFHNVLLKATTTEVAEHTTSEMSQPNKY